MSDVTRLQLLRASTILRENITPLVGELIYDVDQGEPYVGDGVTPGGLPLSPASLAQLLDTDINSLSDGDLLVYNSTTQNWENQPKETPAIRLDEITDVQITGLIDGEVLIYNSATGDWENGSVEDIGKFIDGVDSTIAFYQGKVGVNNNDPQADFQLDGTDNTNPSMLIKAAVSQGTDIVQIRNSSGDIIAGFSSGGQMFSYGGGGGSTNLAFGGLSLQFNTTGFSNMSIGVQAMRFNTTGSNNVAIGVLALASNTSGTRNIALGQDSGRFIADGGANQTPSDSIFIGASTRSRLANETNQIVIGASAIGNGSNTTTIGNDSNTDVYLTGTARANEFTAPGGTFKKTGWGSYSDTQYTELSPFNVATGVTANLPNNSGSSITTYLNGNGDLYDGTVITPWDLGDRLAVSIRMSLKTSSNTGGVILKLDIGGTQGIILTDAKRLLRATGVEQRVNFELTPFTLGTFIANGGTLQVEAVNGDLQIYGINYVIGKIN